MDCCTACWPEHPAAKGMQLLGAISCVTSGEASDLACTVAGTQQERDHRETRKWG